MAVSIADSSPEQNLASGSCAYVLDQDLRIAAIEGPWDRFAVENGGEEVVRAVVVGRSIWDFVSGRDTQSFLNAVFFVCHRENTVFRTEYRCDAPHVRRTFMMTVSAHDAGLVVRHDLVALRLREDADSILRPGLRPINRCSMCCSVRLEDDEWVDLFAPAPEPDFPDRYTLCPTCRDNARKAMNATRDTVLKLRA